jgi:hypothetical protein
VLVGNGVIILSLSAKDGGCFQLLKVSFLDGSAMVDLDGMALVESCIFGRSYRDSGYHSGVTGLW